MITAVSALVLYVAAAFFPSSPEPRYAVFTDLVSCENAVAQVRASGVMVTDCVAVKMGKPKNGNAS